jgi:ketosteroid isomerase-like protein
MGGEEHAALVRRYLEEGAVGNVDSFDELFAPDFVSHRPDGGEVRGPEGMKAFITGLHQRIQGLTSDILELYADGQMVGARLALSGVWAPTGNPIALTEMQLYRIADGKIAERWYAVDRTGLPSSPAPSSASR